MRILSLGSVGTDVMKVQAVLKKIGYNPGLIDGVFGEQMQQAVIQFQKNNGLNSDGIIGPDTYQILERFLLGYDLYRITPRDTLYNLAGKYYINVNRILVANPGINPSSLRVGQEIVIPYSMNVVDTNINYTYEIMERDIRGIKARYPFIEVGIAGQSVLGRNLYYIKLGDGPNQVFYNAAHHALEWITSVVLMKFVEDFASAYAEGRSIRGYNVRDIGKQSTIYIMPMVNPDGISLVLDGLQADNPYYEELIGWNNGRTNFSEVWQANIRGVDLNHNYDAAWELSKQAEPLYGIYGPGPTRYSGPCPESEPESKAVADFTRTHNFRLVLAYHSQGEVIYWDFMNMASPKVRKIGEALSQITGYALDETYGIASFAGYKDWFIQEYRRPGYTIEVGLGKNPLPISQFDKIYNDNIRLLLQAALEVC
ncbi:M14 family metallopeptidase [Petroclostridium xylanilyticum]|uniref:M14 family metallopeptidase n=1 Tax=Petroclostridium xylanilyticum TaxID=1792311 RepID=UPI000B99325A|nr:M14 family metallopeptidase [Petroclostridium xylanilyticum]